MTCEIVCTEERNPSVEVDNDLSAHISGQQCTLCFVTGLEKDVWLKTEKECAFLHTHKRQISMSIISESLKAYHLFP